MQQEVVLAMLAKEPSHGYELRARLNAALGPLGEAINAGQIYVTLSRLEKSGLVASGRGAGLLDQLDGKVYERIAATADRLITMRDGAFVDETRLTGETTGQHAGLAGLEG